MSFDSGSQPLHASALRNATLPQLAALGEFFRQQPFCRVAAVLSGKLKPYQIAARVLLERVKAAAAYIPLTEVTLVIEESSRADSQAKRYLDGYKLIRTEGNRTIDIPINGFFMRWR